MRNGGTVTGAAPFWLWNFASTTTHQNAATSTVQTQSTLLRVFHTNMYVHTHSHTCCILLARSASVCSTRCCSTATSDCTACTCAGPMASAAAISCCSFFSFSSASERTCVLWGKKGIR